MEGLARNNVPWSQPVTNAVVSMEFLHEGSKSRMNRAHCTWLISITNSTFNKTFAVTVQIFVYDLVDIIDRFGVLHYC